jgi:hypothetical protein
MPKNNGLIQNLYTRLWNIERFASQGARAICCRPCREVDGAEAAKVTGRLEAPWPDRRALGDYVLICGRRGTAKNIRVSVFYGSKTAE